MGSRLRALLGVVLILAGFACVPLAVPAGAEPRAVTVATRNLTPFVMDRRRPEIGLHDRESGFTIELWEEVAKRQGWSTKYVDAENVTAQLKDVAEGRADVAAGAISITADRRHWDSWASCRIPFPTARSDG